MKVTAVLQWYDEPPELLDRCIRSLAVVADHLLAVDGAYARFPGGKPASSPEQAEAIRMAADAIGLDCTVLVPDRLWAGQVEKRDVMFGLASIDSDWVLPVAADEIVVGNQTADRGRLALRSFLVNAPLDAYDVSFHTPESHDRPLEDAAATKWARDLAGKTITTTRFHRSLSNLRCERFHWWISALKNGEKVWLSGGDDDPHRKIERGLIPAPLYTIEHHCLTRDDQHILPNRAFCNDRVMVVEQTGQEDDRPDLPRPVWDYVSTLV